MGEWRGIKTFEWKGYEWISRPLWGLNHPDDAFTYYDENMVNVDGEGCLNLDFTYAPEKLPMADGSIVEKPYGRGFCRSVLEFKYGTFEWKMRLPYGKYLWPALWFESDYSWPPEIDCMEGWSERNPEYNKRLFFKSIHPTMHWTGKFGHSHENKKSVCRFWIKGGLAYDRYKTVWTPDYVKIYYNDRLVKTFCNREMLEEMNKPELKFHAVMATGPYAPFSKEDYSEYKKDGLTMKVRDFTYKEL